ncbi:MAG: excinuclease ABC subunit UvrB [Planctomycetota bacterium]
MSSLDPAASPFQLVADFEPAGDQPQAIEALRSALFSGRKFSTLVGVTGSGKTYLMAHAIAAYGKPALVMCPNKTLAAQLYSELKQFFPNNAVEYFVSYYDYYQPEAYIPQRDIYIEKDAAINTDLDRLRLSTTSSLISRSDVVIVASVSCIYGLGSPEEYRKKVVQLRRGQRADRDEILARLVDVQYHRNDLEPERGSFRARGDVVEIFPADDEVGFRVEWFGDEVDRIEEFHTLTGEVLRDRSDVTVYPAKHFVVGEDVLDRAIHGIQEELRARLAELEEQKKGLEAHRLSSRTRYDIELLRETGYCPGIENYSRHLSGRPPGERPHNLFDYFPSDFLCLIDESHVAIPQIGGMYEGDRSRKQTLVDFGFRLPSALDNRPMRFSEWERLIGRAVFISATPGKYELEQCQGEVIEVINRPTGLLDPLVEVHPATGQVQDLIGEIQTTVRQGNRVLVTTLTKRMSEDLAEYFSEANLSCRYLHSEIDTLERVEILQDLRRGRYDVLVGVNLLREGLDLPEVALVAIMDADKEGFLRSETSLVQTIGRAARNERARVILYADAITGSMERAIHETQRRRKIQEAFNREHGIVPRSIRKEIRPTVDDEVKAREVERTAVGEELGAYEREQLRTELEGAMLAAARELDFERAAELRDRIAALDVGGAAASSVKSTPTPDSAKKRGRSSRRGGRR